MTEAEWLACDGEDTGDMQALLTGKGSPRKLRLFAVACCRRIEHLFLDERSRRAIEFAERHADGEVSSAELHRVWREAEQLANELDQVPEDQFSSAHYSAALAAHWAVMPTDDGWEPVGVACHASLHAQEAGDVLAERRAQAKLLCDLLGESAVPKFDAGWRTNTAVALAGQMYGLRDFGAMPILADALQEAGCDSDDILSHCRDASATHVRGCWVVDLVLGKE